MKMIKIVIICLMVKFSKCVDITCDGSQFWERAECSRIETSPLVIEDTRDLYKLDKVKEINSGLIVRNTDIVDFTLPYVTKIENPDGHAIKFEGNHKLRSIKMPNLSKIIPKSKFAPILFKNDHFANQAFKNIDALNDLLELEHHDPDHRNCPVGPGFFKIEEVEEESSDSTFWILIVACVVVFLLDVGLLFWVFKDKFLRKNGKGTPE